MARLVSAAERNPPVVPGLPPRAPGFQGEGQRRIGLNRSLTFMMPLQYTVETLPEPLDPRVKLIKVPGLLMAALSYSGTWSRGRYEEKENRLKELIRQRGLKIVGEPVFARYNPPFMPRFLRRNEVMIPAER
jgi:hypothetical protein